MASKEASLNSNIPLDKEKLTIKKKCILDDVLLRSLVSAHSPCRQVTNVQLSSLQANVVHYLRLVDAGWYTSSSGYGRSLPTTDILHFSAIMIAWSKKNEVIQVYLSSDRHHPYLISF